MQYVLIIIVLFTIGCGGEVPPPQYPQQPVINVTCEAGKEPRVVYPAPPPTAYVPPPHPSQR